MPPPVCLNGYRQTNLYVAELAVLQIVKVLGKLSSWLFHGKLLFDVWGMLWFKHRLSNHKKVQYVTHRDWFKWGCITSQQNWHLYIRLIELKIEQNFRVLLRMKSFGFLCLTLNFLLIAENSYSCDPGFGVLFKRYIVRLSSSLTDSQGKELISG